MEDITAEQGYEIDRRLQDQKLEGSLTLNSQYMRDQQQGFQAAVLHAINPKGILSEIQLTLRGMDIDPKTKKVIQISEPLLNDLGASRMITLTKAILNQSTTIGCLERDEISKLIINLGDDVVDDLTLCWKQYGIKEKSSLDFIVDIIIYSCFMALKRSERGGERNFLKTTTIENISSRPQGFPSEKKGIGGILNKFKL